MPRVHPLHSKAGPNQDQAGIPLRRSDLVRENRQLHNGWTKQIDKQGQALSSGDPMGQ